MLMRKHSFENGGLYHIFNRSVEKRSIFPDRIDFDRFLLGMREFNTIELTGSLWVKVRGKADFSNRIAKKGRLVNVICYCLNPNHYHFILEQVREGGISEYMRRISTGFTQHFNHKYKRTGVLFQGKFKSVPITSNEQLLHVSAYVNLNYRAHGIGNGKSVSSWDEYMGDQRAGFCEKSIVLGQFKNVQEYRKFAESSLKDIKNHKQQMKELQSLLLE